MPHLEDNKKDFINQTLVENPLISIEELD